MNAISRFLICTTIGAGAQAVALDQTLCVRPIKFKALAAK